MPRDDLLPSLRMTHCRKRTAIAYRVRTEIASVLGVYSGGQNYEAQFATSRASPENAPILNVPDACRQNAVGRTKGIRVLCFYILPTCETCTFDGALSMKTVPAPILIAGPGNGRLHRAVVVTRPQGQRNCRYQARQLL